MIRRPLGVAANSEVLAASLQKLNFEPAWQQGHPFVLNPESKTPEEDWLRLSRFSGQVVKSLKHLGKGADSFVTTNIVSPVGVRPVSDSLLQSSRFQRVHPKFYWGEPLPHELALNAIAEFTGTSFFNARGEFRERLSSDEWLRILSFFEIEGTDSKSRHILAERANGIWQASASSESLLRFLLWDIDDTLFRAFHPADLSSKAAWDSIHHYVFRDAFSRLSKAIRDDGLFESGAVRYYAQTQMALLPLVIRLRTGLPLMIATDGDRYTQWLHALHFPWFRYALLGLLPYDVPTLEQVNGAPGLNTTREHAKGIERLLFQVREKQIAKRREGESLSVYSDLSLHSRLAIGYLLFGQKYGYKPYRSKNPLLRALKTDGTYEFSHRVMIDDNDHHGRSGLELGVSHFIHLPRRPAGIKRAGFYGSMLLQDHFGEGVQGLGHSYLPFGQNRGSLDELAGWDIESAVIAALNDLQGAPLGQLRDLDDQQALVGHLGMRMTRAIYHHPFRELSLGSEANVARAKRTIRALKSLLQRTDDMAAIDADFSRFMAGCRL